MPVKLHRHESPVVRTTELSEIAARRTSRPMTVPAANTVSPTHSIQTITLSFILLVPSPTNLHVEKSLNSSILIAWDPPQSGTQILGYQILLDHSVYTTVRATDRTRALIENLDFKDKPHRISIRTITQRGLSHEQKCTLLLNSANEVSIVPTDLRVDRINQTSAIVSWWVASNEVAHQLLVNDVELQTLQPGVYRFKLSGLVPNTMHKVTIRAKPSVAPRSPQQQPLSTSLDFRTTAFGMNRSQSLSLSRRADLIPTLLPAIEMSFDAFASFF